MPRVLLVDDHADVRLLWRVVLEAAGGYEIAEAGDGAAAIAEAAETRPDVVVTDLAMPVASGFEVIRAIRAAYPGTVVVACSGTDGEREALDHGASAFLAKERSVTDLAPTVVACLAR
ncbi:MAG: response regulator [Acidimicrobiia bacterium]